ncbi:MAG: hypothetical protein WDN09_03940 [bacterium]
MTKIKLILPSDNVGFDLKEGERLYFLAGPIRGGGGWQFKAIKMLAELDPWCYIACPHGHILGLELYKYPFEVKNHFISFPNQTLWERHYLEQASWHGAVIFWLPCEDKYGPREGGNYARDTRGEIARWSLKSARFLDYSLHQDSLQNARGERHRGRRSRFPGAQRHPEKP